MAEIGTLNVLHRLPEVLHVGHVAGHAPTMAPNSSANAAQLAHLTRAIVEKAIELTILQDAFTWNVRNHRNDALPQNRFDGSDKSWLGHDNIIFDRIEVAALRPMWV